MKQNISMAFVLLTAVFVVGISGCSSDESTAIKQDDISAYIAEHPEAAEVYTEEGDTDGAR